MHINNHLFLQASGSNPASLKTRVTQRSKSSKNRRKGERKKYSTKEGSVFEDIGLVAEMHQAISGAYKATEATADLLRAQVRGGEIFFEKKNIKNLHVSKVLP